MSEEEASSQEEEKFTIIDFLPVTITWLCIVAQIVLTFALWGNYYDLDYLVYIGYGLWGLGAVFGVLPIVTLKRKGGVKKGDSYIKTTNLVKSGLYVIVRHPQYLAGIIISLALVYMSQHLVVDLLFLGPLITTTIDTLQADKALVKKFGEEYQQYMKQVPRLEPISGVIRLIIRKLKKQ